MIRHATFDDIPHLVELGRSLHAESALQVVAFDDHTVMTVFRKLIEAESSCVIMANAPDGGAIGMLALHVGTPIFNQRVRIAKSLFLYVSQGFRDGGFFRDMRSEAETWARKQECMLLCTNEAKPDGQRRGRYQHYENLWMTHLWEDGHV